MHGAASQRKALYTETEAACTPSDGGVSCAPGLQVADSLERRSHVIEILTDAVKAYQAADVMETQGEIYLKNLGMLSDSLDDLKDRHEGAAAEATVDALREQLSHPAQRGIVLGLQDGRPHTWISLLLMPCP